MSSGQKAAATAILADVAIGICKLAAFLFTGSAAMLSETIHSFVDAGNSALLVLGMRLGKRPADPSHPFGYGKELYFWTLLVALFIFLAGGLASAAEGIRHVLHPEPIEHVIWNYVTLAIAGCFEGYSLHVGIREFRETEHRWPSWRAIHRSKDPAVFTVVFEDTAAIAGVLTALIATLLGQLFHWQRADGIASILIGVVLMSVAVLLIAESKALLVGEGADPEILNAIHELTEQQPGVRRAGYPMTMYFGPRDVLLTMNVRLDKTLDRDGIEQTIDRIEAAVRQRFPEVRHIYLEAESLHPNARLDNPAYPEPTDLPPTPR